MKTDYKKLIDNICSNENLDEQKEDLETITELIMPAMLRYVNAVCKLEFELPIIKRIYSGKEYQDHFSALDSKRTSAHENLISNVRKLNRLASIYGIEPLFTGDENNRYEIAGFAMSVVHQFFEDRIGVPR